MALKRNERYPGRFSNPNAAHPQGAFKNRTSPTSQDGSYLESDWANDWDGFFARLLTVAGVTANGNVDTGTSSQYYDALVTAIKSALGTAAQRNVGNGASQIPDMSFFVGSNTTNGYQKFPNGLIFQWGQTALPVPGTSTTITYPIAFPSTVYGVIPGMNATSANTGIGPCAATIVNAASFAFTMFPGAAFGSSVAGYWFAFGR